MKAKFLKNRFGIANQRLVLFITFFRVRKFEKLNFLKLVLTQNAARIFPSGARFGAETRGPRGKRRWGAGFPLTFRRDKDYEARPPK